MNLLIERIRWVSAFVVVLGHLRSIMYGAYDIKQSTPFEKLILFLTGFGHQAVVVFFLLSGYLVAKPFLNKQLKKNLINYYWRRFIRIYPVLFVSLLLSLLAQIILKSNINLNQYILGFLNLGSILDNNLEINKPLWSLNYEWYYYMIWPLFFIQRKGLRIITPIILIGLSFIQLKFVLYSMFWVIGIYLDDARIKNMRLSSYLIIATTIISLVLLRFHRGELTGIQYFLNLIFAISTLILLNKNLNNKIILNPLEILFSKISYSLYVTHYPVIILTQEFLIDYSFEFRALIGFISSILLAILVSTLIEQPLLKFKKL